MVRTTEQSLAGQRLIGTRYGFRDSDDVGEDSMPGVPRCSGPELEPSPGGWETQMIRSRSLRTLPFLVIVGLWAVASPARAQETKGEPAPGSKPVVSRDDGRKPVETESEFRLWKQAAQLELEILRAQIEAKEAEIKRREAEYRIGRLAPTRLILARLEEPVSMSFANETPLEDVLKYIKSATQGPNDTGIPIYVDPAGLSEAEKTMTSPVSLDLEGVPLKTTLRLLLKQLGLTYAVEDGLLTITKGR